ncbi:MAG: tetratricopeptide repeat protein [Clostridia bacterium]|nr:tetratricopeptide repeat protein [Clostridia bacterium]
MSLINLKCKNCSASVSLDMNAKSITCAHCGSTFLLQELIDEKDIEMVESLSEKDFQEKVDFNDAIKHGDIALFQGDFDKAEQYYKRAIQLNEKDFRGYYGVVRSKTHNLNIIPDSNDFKEYAKLAIKFVPHDEEIHIKSELSKLNALEVEKKLMLVQKKQQEEKNKIIENNRRKIDTRKTRLGILIVLIVAIIAVAAILITREFLNNAKTQTNYEVSTVEEFNKLNEVSNWDNKIIVIKNDIDFGGQEINSIGSEQKPFTGSIYGNGHTISNFKLSVKNENGSAYAGIINVAKNARISALKIKQTSVSISSNVSFENAYIGLIVAKCDDSTIQRISITDEISMSVNLKANSLFAGEIVGFAANSDISNSFVKSTANLNLTIALNESSNFVGGFAGKIVATKNKLNSLAINTTYFSGTINTSVLNDTDQTKIYFGELAGEVENTSTMPFTISSTIAAGKINIAASNANVYFAGIANPKNIQYSAVAIVFDESIIFNEILVEALNLEDYSALSEKFVTDKNDELVQKIIEDSFTNDIWAEHDLGLPVLK